jgi:Family of unknown function (DUF5984)
MLFDFSLCPLEEVQPWGESPNLSLSWFGFTEGFYRLKLGSIHLLNYSDGFINYCSNKFPDAYNGSLVDYQVVRLWEDVLDRLPYVLELVPTELHKFLTMDYETWSSWYDKAVDWRENQLESGSDKDEVWDIMDAATSWRNNRWLDAGYLQNAPNIWMWSTDEEVYISWDNQNITVDGISVWSAIRGTHSKTRSQFLDEVRAFNNELIFQMGQRVESICANWDRSEIFVDIAGLKREQTERSLWLENALQRTSSTEWNQVLSAIDVMSIE